MQGVTAPVVAALLAGKERGPQRAETRFEWDLRGKAVPGHLFRFPEGITTTVIVEQHLAEPEPTGRSRMAPVCIRTPQEMRCEVPQALSR
jgi:hypothetical protein